jgi:hypothetical protein
VPLASGPPFDAQPMPWIPGRNVADRERQLDIGVLRLARKASVVGTLEAVVQALDQRLEDEDRSATGESQERVP